ncbi:uncharacterized protein MELLADRAFT_68905 [Melampsora larici-populina 98AG31]|uniref:CCHC-type domain-containing protein n=1 Tax=Melampsora larici-populina (strain 98AG31 / pathotype 3-4-7) TaxID=747676 RepID=F4S8M9_MELLP|nr:uncharacterized protein MELLADRAFT_68905 [Melampsora larici-populina 98AG31]EGF98924.1 hypothetical protein MELLADRAFT_68905 [Melampsora larici-populina 98AG31]
MLKQDMLNPSLADILWYQRLSNRDKSDALPLDISPNAHPFVLAGQGQCYYCAIFGHRQFSCPMKAKHKKGELLAGEKIGRPALPFGEWRRVKNGKTYSTDMLGGNTQPIVPRVRSGPTAMTVPGNPSTSTIHPPASYVPHVSSLSVHPPSSPGVSSSDEEYLAQLVAELDAGAKLTPEPDSNPLDDDEISDRAADIMLIDERGDIEGNMNAIELVPDAVPGSHSEDVEKTMDDSPVIQHSRQSPPPSPLSKIE